MRRFMNRVGNYSMRSRFHVSSNVKDGSPSSGADSRDVYASHCEAHPRLSPLHIQMLSKRLHDQIFQSKTGQKLSSEDLQYIKNHLKQHDLWDKKTSPLEDIDLELPPLLAESIDEHLKQLATKQVEPYVEQAAELCRLKCLAPPQKWMYKAGWTRYDPQTRKAYAVECPLEDAIVFDVEVLVTAGDVPMLATAVTPKAWYSWCNERLVNKNAKVEIDHLYPKELIPLESAATIATNMYRPRVIVGHNVGYDRSFISEQYFMKGPQTYFLDTMSLHIVISGQTSFQRILFQAEKSQSQRKEVLERLEQANIRGPPNTKWMKETTLNNLNDVYQHHCKGKPLKKHIRDVFVKGSIDDVRQDFQQLMSYCAQDVIATLDVFKVLWPQLPQRLPHPVSLCGMLEMGSTYLPINENWLQYKERSQETCDKLKGELMEMIKELLNEACKLQEGQRYKEDMWLWDLDWTVMQQKGKRKVHMAGYPNWYRDLCARPIDVRRGVAEGPVNLTTKKRIVPKLLRLTWDGFPLHYNANHGWGYLVPWIDRGEEEELEEEKDDDDNEFPLQQQEAEFPLKQLQDFCFQNNPNYVKAQQDSPLRLQLVLDNLYKKYEAEEDDNTRMNQWGQIKQLETQLKQRRRIKTKKEQEDIVESGQHYHKGNGPYDVGIKGVDFFRLPHKDGPMNKVGNPLSKDFMAKVESGVLKSAIGHQASTVLRLSNMTSYWENNRKRINGQRCVQLQPAELPEAVTSEESFNAAGYYGAILPRVVTAGTVTRRAVEPTWLTASNAYRDRVGSELKGMIQTPPGYHFVGADVDSQELWIAAILGDAYFKGIHGCTAFGWMTLCGNKAEGTDLHSKTAGIVGISRDQAKVFNYGRIYGAGERFAQRLLMQFNHRLTSDEARTKAKAMFQATKGKRQRGKRKTLEEIEDSGILKGPGLWEGGSESFMFNQLEAIAKREIPRTPVLDCRISKALEPNNVDEDFMTSRINWVVQSTAVDYLHLMLVCMKWLMAEYDIDGRFCISIHDEVRYLVKSEDRYRAALALQITNLITRSMFAYRLGMNDLPQSVAFFSAVDIDTCLRKEVTLDCQTPSNPEGLEKTYGIQKGEALTIYDIIKKTNGSLKKTEQPSDGSD